MWPSKVFLFFCLIPIIQNRKNVLFLVSDDMRPELAAYYGQDFPTPIHPQIHSPNLDALASKSILLKRAYVQQAVCSPSRTSLLTGRRPDTTHVYDLVKYFRDVGGNFTTLPEYFKLNGYTVAGMGKIFHPGKASGYDDPSSWNVPYFHASNQARYTTKQKSWRAVPTSEYVAYPLPDRQIADNAITTLRTVAPPALSGDKNFFVAVGFHKPHLPFLFEEDFLNLYPRENIRLPDNGYAPVDMPSVAWFSYGGLRSFHDIAKLNASGNINTSLPNDTIIDLRRAYYSALSYTDFQVGRVIAELENLGLGNNTIVSFWADHGWQLGEHGEWCKQTNFEDAVHAPMMIHIPGLTDKGVVTEQLTEFVDLYPTLVEAAGLPVLDLCPEDSTKVALCREGTSLMPLILNPSIEFKRAVFSQYPRSTDGHNVMGYTMRTDRYRYTEWPEFTGSPDYKPLWGNVFGIELYDHNVDPEENHNRAYDLKYSAVRQRLTKQLHDGWRHN
ncbi:hypothetical protein LOTGIDRAFT_153520 [Lottia gigantea]|uniref:Sulfatase N-terminal domain-containing protein n=1 Tax=Lottia gigantea TaxID=225164 RepID=V4BY56_LOTGI|nr:hypothetical protein LOTGIDRAFT_153520 [Lottia gigantea]ESO94039.1 hypothetical protein LOTGIDRAFT_153520 [Lottia gigantea]